MIEIIAAKKCGRKTCARAGVVLPIRDFSGNANTRDGYRYECKDCQRAYNSSYVKRVRKGPKKVSTGLRDNSAGWPVPAEADLAVQLLNLHTRRAYGAVPMCASW